MTTKYELPVTIKAERYAVLLTMEPLVPSTGIDFVKKGTPEAGAVVYFGGITRNSFQGKPVQHLAYDCYVPMALRTLERIAKEALAGELKNETGSASHGDDDDDDDDDTCYDVTITIFRGYDFRGVYISLPTLPIVYYPTSRLFVCGDSLFRDSLLPSYSCNHLSSTISVIDGRWLISRVKIRFTNANDPGSTT